MMSCWRTRALLVDSQAGRASEGERLGLDSHLVECADCRAEQSRLALLGILRRYEPPAPTEAAIRRLLVRAREAAPPAAPTLARSRWRPLATGLVAGAVALLLVAAAARTWMRSPARVLPDELALGGDRCFGDGGVVRFAGAEVIHRPGTTLRFDRAARAIVLSGGEVDVAAQPEQGRALRVVTPRFTVEVMSSRFVVAASGVQVRSGEARVQVIDQGEHEIVILRAGESWATDAVVADPATCAAIAKPPATVAPPALVAAAVADPPRAVAGPPPDEPPPADPTTTPAPSREAVRVAPLVERARAALADGDTAEARQWLRRARAADPSLRERALLDLLSAQTLLVERRYGEAIDAYRRTARAHAQLPEGEVAAFAAGQLLLEQGRRHEAEAALGAYLARYPSGRFAREAGERIVELRPAE